MKKTLYWIVGGIVGLIVLANLSNYFNTPNPRDVVGPSIYTSSVPTVSVTPVVTPTPQPTAKVVTPAPTKTSPTSRPDGLNNSNYYTNSSGNSVHSPAYSAKAPAGASAQCRDGSYSFSQHRSGTCSHHGGVASWL